MNIYKQRLLNVARAAREILDAGLFSMSAYTIGGQPRCLLAHYAARPDLQDFVHIPDGIDRYVSDNSQINSEPRLFAHFRITESEFEALFSAKGCGGARTRTEAAAYIESFLERPEIIARFA